MSNSCPFCEIEESRLAFQDHEIVAVWDLYPVTEGHLLIIPRRHVASWFEATRQEQIGMIQALDRGRELIQKKYGTSEFNFGVNDGQLAGQTVPHLHMHLIPRYEQDVTDPRGGIRHVIPGRGNYQHSTPAGVDLLKGLSSESLLVRGQEDALLPHLCRCLDQSIRLDFAIAFVMKSGVALIREHLRDFLDRGGTARILTGDYLNATDPDALVELLDLTGRLELRVFEATETSFHPKAYLFEQADGRGTAFVGSSNLTYTALREGVEWNYRIIRSKEEQGFDELKMAFESLFHHPQSRAVDQDWIEQYRQRRTVPVPTPEATLEIVLETSESPPPPHEIQQEALAALAATREAGNEAGLVVLATGLGKTWLAAFDSESAKFQRVLFVAHREEILRQAMQTFRRIRPQARLGLYTGKEKSPEADVLFASIQTLGRLQHLRQFDHECFDYIIVDEFHHAAARTYRQLIDHFIPQFLLGLTATPERMDGGDLLALCQENLVYRKDLVAGIRAKLLCPFHYFGVPDDIDYSNIPWRSSRFDEEALTNAIATRQRAENALEQYRKHAGSRTLGFCCSQRHADFMADFFVERGVRAVAVHSGKRSAPRASALESLADGGLEIIFAVDMFNEGLDLPQIDTVLMLRPTESNTIWLQQFGRGLRTADGKSKLTIIDYIGNHRTFLIKVRSLLQPLLGTGESDAELSAAMRLIQQGNIDLPPGCEVTYDLATIDIIKGLLRTRSTDDVIIGFYDDFKERHGTRPLAVELYHAGYNPRSLRKTHGSWTKFLGSMGDLEVGERVAVQELGDFLDALETTPMTKSFKMLTLQAMLNQDAFPGEIDISQLVTEFRRIVRRSKILRDDVGEALEEDASLQALLEKNPIKAWTDGKGTKGEAFFRYENDRFCTIFPEQTEVRTDLQNLVRELVDWRLAEYLNRGHETVSKDGFVCRVMHANQKPILKLPKRESNPGIPSGWVDIEVGGKPYVANFVKLYLNVIRTSQEEEPNLLPEIIRGWYGEDAGLPGTRYEVAFEPTGDGWKMEPIGDPGVAEKAILWNHYKREDIPPLFDLEFNTGLWNQGFVATDKNLFLLVTLEKKTLNKDHRYEDLFLSPTRFQWQSQNRTKQESRHGKLIHDHQQLSIDVQLFVRRHKLVDGKAAPFVYCGPLVFENWEGEQPISVKWKLEEAVPASLYDILDVPNSTDS